jgi:glycosyltransferase involved in cell wall biosynthesis
MQPEVIKPRRLQRGRRRPSRVRTAKPRASPTRSDSARRAIIVLGMHRSGTSALTRVISLLGADLPNGLVQGPDNEAGFWESAKLAAIHDEILSSAGSSWDDWRAFDQNWYASSQAPIFKARVLELLQKDFASSRLFVVKDPRICRLWPFWRDVLEELGAKPAVAIPIRNPVEVAASLERRNGLAPARGYLLWLRHVIDAEQATRGLPRAIVTYSALLDDWQRMVRTLGSRLEISWPKHRSVAGVEIEQFLSTRLRHHAVATTDLATRVEVADWVKEAFSAPMRISVTPDHAASTTRLDRIGNEFQKASEAFGLALAEGELELTRRGSENKQLRAASKALQHRVSILSDEQWCLRGDAEASEARLREELEGARAAIFIERQKAADRSAQVAGLVEARADAEASRAVAAEEVRQLRSERQELRRRLSDLSDEQRRLGIDAEAAAAKSKEALETAFETLSMERQKSAELTDRLSEVEAARNLAETGCAAAAEKLRRLEAELAARVQASAAQSKAIESARASQADTERENAELRRLVDEFERILTGERDALKEALASVADLRSALASRTDELTQLDEMLSEARAQAAAVSADREVRLAEIDGALSASHRREVDLNATVVQQANELAVLSSELAEQRALARDSHGKFAAAEERHHLAVRASAAVEESLSAERAIASRAHLRALQAEAQARDSEVKTAQLEQSLENLLKSTSWKLSAPWRAYRRSVRRLGRVIRLEIANPLFDRDWYLKQNRDVDYNEIDPYTHYLLCGAAEGRNPNELFDTDWYLAQNQDVRLEGMNPLLHYYLHGAAEGRNPSPQFDGVWYLEHYPDVRGAGINPLLHFLHYGRNEGRQSRPVISPAVTAGRDDSASGVPKPYPAMVVPFRSDQDLVDMAVASFLKTLSEETSAYGPVDAVILLPVLGRGGSEKVAASFSQAIRGTHADRSVLLIVTDFDVIDPRVPLPQGVFAHCLSDFLLVKNPRLKEVFLFRIIQLLSPRLFHVINSDLGWRLVQTHAARLSHLTNLYASMFCMQRNYETRELIGFAATYFRDAARHCKAIMTDNQAFIAELLEHFPEDARAARLVPVYNPVSWATDKPRPPIASPGTRRGRPAILWAGRLDRQKRIEVLFDVAAQLRHFDFHVYGSKVTDGDAEFRSLANVLYEGSFLSVTELIGARTYDAYIHTTYEEGLPNIILELGELGIPIVAPAVGGIPEVVNETTGYLLSAFPDGHEYADVLESLVSNPAEAQRRAKALKALVEIRHCWANFASTVASIPGYLMSERGS